MKFLFESDITLFLQKSRSMDLQLKSMSACKLSICFCCTRSDKKLRIKRPKSKSLFISCVVSYFYETKFEIFGLENFAKVGILLIYFHIFKGRNIYKIRVSVHCSKYPH